MDDQTSSNRAAYAIVRCDVSLQPLADGDPKLYIKVVKVLDSEAIAIQECERLMAIRRSDSAQYFVSATHISAPET